jgi:hypothetical protein
MADAATADTRGEKTTILGSYINTYVIRSATTPGDVDDNNQQERNIWVKGDIYTITSRKSQQLR